MPRNIQHNNRIIGNKPKADYNQIRHATTKYNQGKDRPRAPGLKNKTRIVANRHNEVENRNQKMGIHRNQKVLPGNLKSSQKDSLD